MEETAAGRFSLRMQFKYTRYARSGIGAGLLQRRIESIFIYFFLSILLLKM